MKRFLLSAAAGLALVGAALAAPAPPIPYITSPWDPTNALGVLNGWIQGQLTPFEGSAQSQSMGRNLLDNGALWVNQRAATATCATTAGLVEASYGPDRWGCDVNMATGAGQLAVITSSPTPPPQFVNAATLVRNSGSLGQPQCAWQELSTSKAAQLQGQQVIISAYAQALGALAADNGNQVYPVLVTGTGAAQGMGALRSAVGNTTTVKNSSFTISTTTGLITNATSVVAGQPVWITAATMPVGMTTGQYYYVSSALLNSGTAFAVADTYAHAIAGTNTVIPSTGGTTDVISVPYITPIWTGLAVYGTNNAGQGQTSAAQAFGQVVSQPYTLSSTSWMRINTTPIQVPTNVTEAAVGLCFNPSAAASGAATDGFAFTGVQAELVSVPGQVVPSPFELRDPALETQAALRYYEVLNDRASGTPIGPVGTLLTTTTCGFVENFPVPMDTSPVFNAIGTITTTTFQIYVAADTSTLTAAGITAATLTTPYSAGFTGTLTTASTAGWACELMGQTASTAIGLSWGADF